MGKKPKKSRQKGNRGSPAATSNSSSSRSSTGYGFKLNRGKLCLVLLVVILILLITHTLITVYHYQIEETPWLLRQLFDLDEENNIPTWFSGFQLLIPAFLLWTIASSKKLDRIRYYRHWYFLSFGFLFLSLDEVAGIHETFNSIVTYSWTIPGGIITLVILFFYIPFLFHLPRKTAILFFLSGFIYAAGSIIIELVGPNDTKTFFYNLSTVVEEGLEMLGILFFIYLLLDYMKKEKDTIPGVTVNI